MGHAEPPGTPVTNAPVPKVIGAGIGGAAATVLIWIIQTVAHTDVPAEVGAAIATLAAFLFGYFTPHSS